MHFTVCEFYLNKDANEKVRRISALPDCGDKVWALLGKEAGEVSSGLRKNPGSGRRGPGICCCKLSIRFGVTGQY